MDESSEQQSRNAKGLRGPWIIAGILLLGVVVGIYGYYEVPRQVVDILEKRPAVLDSTFEAMEAALRAYYVDYQDLPPAAPLPAFRRNTKNLASSHAYGMTTIDLRPLTSPLAYIKRNDIADPFAMPDQYAPPAGAILRLSGEARGVVLSSPGPNLVYDVRTSEIEQIEDRGKLGRLLLVNTYDPSNGTRGGGDFFRVIDFSFETSDTLE